MSHYVGVLEGEGDVWSIRVPDLPGCHGGGASPDEAVVDTISAMSEWAVTVASDGFAIPVARAVRAVTGDPETEFNPGTESVVLLPLLHETGRPVKANVSIDAGMLSAIDAAAKLRGMTRSAFLVAAAREKIARAAT